MKRKRRDMDEIITLINSNHHSFYKIREWKDKRLIILERDHYECQRCAGQWKPKKYIKPKTAKYVHHIRALKDYPELSLSDDNLVSLCFNCHEEIEERTFVVRRNKLLTEENW